jgi:hypothetical protein
LGLARKRLERRCIRSCDPLKKWAKTRVFEISSSTCVPPDMEGDPLALRVGCALEGEVACVYDQTDPEAPPLRIDGLANGKLARSILAYLEDTGGQLNLVDGPPEPAKPKPPEPSPATKTEGEKPAKKKKKK